MQRQVNYINQHLTIQEVDSYITEIGSTLSIDPATAEELSNRKTARKQSLEVKKWVDAPATIFVNKKRGWNLYRSHIKYITDWESGRPREKWWVRKYTRTVAGPYKSRKGALKSFKLFQK